MSTPDAPTIPRLPTEPDRSYAGIQRWFAGRTHAEIAAELGVSTASVKKDSSLYRWRERIAEVAAGPGAEPGDRVSRAIENGMGALLGWLETLSPDEVKAVDAARIAEACQQLRNGTVAVTPPPWTDAAHRDLLRGLLSDLPPSDPACPFDVRRLTWEQREVFTWLFERAMGDAKPFRAPGELVSGSPAQAEPAYHAVTSDMGGGNVPVG